MTSPAGSLRRFFFAPVDHTALAVCRFVFGACLLLQYLGFATHVQEIWGPEGFVGSVWRESVPWLGPIARDSALSLRLPFLFTASGTWILYSALLLAALSFALGWRARASGALLLLLHGLFHSQNEFVFWGWAALIKPFLLYVVLADSDRWYSLAAWLRERRLRPVKPWVGLAWPVRLIQIHLLTLYLVVAWTRVDDPNWLNGSMLYGILTDTVFSRIDSDWLWAKDYLRALCYASWGLELAAPALLVWRPTRRPAVAALALMHVGLEALTMVGYWNGLVLAALYAYWRDRDSWF